MGVSLSSAPRRCLGHPLHSILQRIVHQPVRWEVRFKKGLSDDARRERRQRAQAEQALAARRLDSMLLKMIPRDVD